MFHPGIREKWRCRTVTEHLPSERWAQGIFFLHHRTKNRHDRCPAPLNAYIQEEIHHGSDSIQNSENFSLCVCPTGGTRDTGIWYSSALRSESSFFCFFFPRWCCWMLFAHHVTLPAVNKNATSNGVLRRAQQGAGFYQYRHSTTRQITCSIARTLQAPMISIILSFPVLIICIRLHVSVLGPIAFSGWGIGCNSITSLLSVPLDSVPRCRTVYTLSHAICLKLINLNQSKIGSPSSPASHTHIS